MVHPFSFLPHKNVEKQFSSTANNDISRKNIQVQLLVSTLALSQPWRSAVVAGVSQCVCEAGPLSLSLCLCSHFAMIEFSLMLNKEAISETNQIRLKANKL